MNLVSMHSIVTCSIISGAFRILYMGGGGGKTAVEEIQLGGGGQTGFL